MSDTIKFPAFRSFVCEGDYVEVEHCGFTLRATVYRDDCRDTPEERHDGFWPSLDPHGAGFIGAKSASTFRRHMAHARHVLEAWERDEWFYCGVAVTAWRDGVQLTHEYGAAVWGIECNYPPRRKGAPSDNSYLSVVAGELSGEALNAAWAHLDKMLEAATDLAS